MSNNFLDQLKRKQAAAKSEPQTTAPEAERPITEMSENELDLEIERARADLLRLKQAELAATREATASPARPRFLTKRTPRRPWK